MDQDQIIQLEKHRILIKSIKERSKDGRSISLSGVEQNALSFGLSLLDKELKNNGGK